MVHSARGKINFIGAKMDRAQEDKVDAILRVASDAKIRERVENRLNDAEHKASDALNTITKHEEICELRYANINVKLNMLDTIQQSMTALNRTANIAIGAWLGTLGLATVLGIVATIFTLKS